MLLHISPWLCILQCDTGSLKLTWTWISILHFTCSYFLPAHRKQQGSNSEGFTGTVTKTVCSMFSMLFAKINSLISPLMPSFSVFLFLNSLWAVPARVAEPLPKSEGLRALLWVTQVKHGHTSHHQWSSPKLLIWLIWAWTLVVYQTPNCCYYGDKVDNSPFKGNEGLVSFSTSLPFGKFSPCFHGPQGSPVCFPNDCSLIFKLMA